MVYWIPYAFLRITVFFIAGIISAICHPNVLSIANAATAFAGCVVLYFIIYFVNHHLGKKILNPGFVGLLTIFVAGYVHLQISTMTNSPIHLSSVKGEIRYFTGTISGFGQEKEKSWKETLEVNSVMVENKWVNARGKVVVYFPKREFLQSFKYGDAILLAGSPQSIPKPANPGEFDQEKFLSYKNITHQKFASADQASLVKRTRPSDLIYYSLAARDWAEAALKRVVEGQREQAIASALVLGITDGLDNELMGAYAATGAMHVLSVSGLHVGILYMVLMLFLKPLEKAKSGKWIVAGIVLLLLWVYACVTGLSPSVLRSVTMFSFVVVARPLAQRTNIFNVLAASAFFLLLYDPYLIMSVGFQLSYLAVLGIVYLQPSLYEGLQFENRIADELWKVTTVSLAAQLVTFPLGLYYFHQFPNYFLISNLYVLPLGFGILIAGLAILVTSFIEPVAAVIGSTVKWMIQLLNYLIIQTESLPWSVIDNVKLSGLQCLLLFVLIIGLILFFQYRKLQYFYIAALSIVMVSTLSVVDYLDKGRATRLIVYHVSGHSAFDLTEPGVTYFFSDSSLRMNQRKVSFHITPNRILHYAHDISEGENQSFVRSMPFGKLIVRNGKTILHANKEVPAHRKVDIDYLIISDNSIGNLGQLMSTWECKQIIVDSSNSFKFADKLLKDAALNNLKLHSVWHHGAFNIIL